MSSFKIKILLFLLVINSTHSIYSTENKDVILKIKNMTNRIVDLQHGDVNFLRRWNKTTPQIFSIESGKEVERHIPCDSNHCIHAKRKLNADEDEPSIVEFFSEKHSKYVISFAAYGVTFLVTNEIAGKMKDQFDTIIPENSKIKFDEFHAKNITQVTHHLKDIFQDSLKHIKKDDPFHEVFKISLNKVLPSLAKKSEEEFRKYFEVDLIDVILQKSLAELALQTAHKSGPKWLEDFIDNNPFLVKILTKYCCAYMSSVVWKSLAPKYVAFLSANPMIAGKKVGVALLGYTAFYHYKSSPYASCYFKTGHEDEYEDTEVIEVCIKNFGYRTIRLENLG